ncbi:hypothetical protein [Congregibacter litoralis]|uniref:hypothetical protein n=1 Tax=Congregibacter litoralis TaxID=393662 RepID=UPI000319FB53|nr:hypothetical protein [Congregibacter litoralis]
MGETAADGTEAIITWGAVNVGDFVLFEGDGTVLQYLRRVAPDTIDAPPASPLQGSGASAQP